MCNKIKYFINAFKLKKFELIVFIYAFISLRYMLSYCCSHLNKLVLLYAIIKILFGRSFNMYDVHTHFVPANVINWIKENQKTINTTFQQKDPNKEDFLVVDQKWGFELKEAFTNADLYLEEQNKAGISHSLVSPIPQLFLYDFPVKVTSELASEYNRGLADWVHTENKRLSALATVPLNDPEKAAEELKHSLSVGLKGAIIAPMCADKMITDEFFTPFWEEANKLGAIIFLHPLLNNDPRIKKRKMPNLIGVPWETTVCATDIVL